VHCVKKYVSLAVLNKLLLNSSSSILKKKTRKEKIAVIKLTSVKDMYKFLQVLSGHEPSKSCYVFKVIIGRFCN
jgi:hypothetical protein